MTVRDLRVHGDAVTGFARGITDGLSNGLLSMVAVAPAHRRRGLGCALVQHVIGGNADVTWRLRAGCDDVPAFFASLGFHVSGQPWSAHVSKVRTTRPLH